jgi:hypothetical protein
MIDLKLKIFLEAVRRALLLIVKAIEEYAGIEKKPLVCPHCGDRIKPAR